MEPIFLSLKPEFQTNVVQKQIRKRPLVEGLAWRKGKYLRWSTRKFILKVKNGLDKGMTDSERDKMSEEFRKIRKWRYIGRGRQEFIKSQLKLLAQKTIAKGINSIKEINPGLLIGFLEDKKKFIILKPELNAESLEQTQTIISDVSKKLKILGVGSNELHDWIHDQNRILVDISLEMAVTDTKIRKNDNDRLIRVNAEFVEKVCILEGEGYDISSIPK